MKVERISYQAGSVTSQGALIFDENIAGPRPLLLVAPNWLGVTQESIDRAATIAGSEYIAFVADMYGDGRIASGPLEAGPLADELRANAPERRQRISAALDTLCGESKKRNIGDLKRRAAVGFCFGGGNVLELARAGADIQAVICLHGDLLTPLPAKPGDIKAAICVMHGSADPVVPKSDRDTIEAELSAASAKWQMTVFGGLLHSFCEVESDTPGIARYDADAARQCFAMIDAFAKSAFDKAL